MTKECWLFLDCQVMTGYPSDRCPNYRKCKHNALHSGNRTCILPYTRQLWNEDDFLPQENYLRVDYDSDAIEAGWQCSTPLFYSYNQQRKILEVWDDLYPIPLEAKQLGFAEAQLLPYYYCDRQKKLTVKSFVLKGQELADFLAAGWHHAIELPYSRYYDYKTKQFVGIIVWRKENGWIPSELINSENLEI